MQLLYDFSIVIPHKDSVNTLIKLIESIPDNKKIQIIVVDNSINPISKVDVVSNRNFELYYSPIERFAGGARNVGVEHAKGRWLIFADADDYFAKGAFDVFYSMFNSDADVIYTCAQGIYVDTGERSDRGTGYAELVRGYLSGKIQEIDLRTRTPVPWCKMIKREIIECNNIRFDEILAGNDIYFSLLVGYYAKKVKALDVITYNVTVSRGTLTKRLDFEAIKARLYSKLHCNQFLRSHGLANRQHSVMFAFVRSRRYTFIQRLELLKMIIKFRQNPFIGYSNWFKTIKSGTKDKKYFVS